MDPNATLARLVALSDLIRDGGLDDPSQALTGAEAAAEMADLIYHLDAWLTQGGFLPITWERGMARLCPHRWEVKPRGGTLVLTCTLCGVVDGG